MPKDPAFLFYPNDYIGGTMGMTFEEKGAYMELLMLQFNRGHMTSDMIGQTIGQLWVKIQDKFKIDDKGLYYNTRLENEIEKRKTFVQSRFNNLLGKNQYSKKQGHKKGHMSKHMEDINVNEDIIKDLYNSVVIFFDEDCRPKDEKQIKDWYDTLDKLIRIDNYSPEAIHNIIKHTRMDDFWRMNFLSVTKLRKKNKDGIPYFIVFEKKINNATKKYGGADPFELAELTAKKIGIQ